MQPKGSCRYLCLIMSAAALKLSPSASGARALLDNDAATVPLEVQPPEVVQAEREGAHAALVTITRPVLLTLQHPLCLVCRQPEPLWAA